MPRNRTADTCLILSTMLVFLLRSMRMSYLKTYVVLVISRRIVIVTIFVENIDLKKLITVNMLLGFFNEFF
jgi:hypothetical protein